MSKKPGENLRTFYRYHSISSVPLELRGNLQDRAQRVRGAGGVGWGHGRRSSVTARSVRPCPRQGSAEGDKARETGGDGGGESGSSPFRQLQATRAPAAFTRCPGSPRNPTKADQSRRPRPRPVAAPSRTFSSNNKDYGPPAGPATAACTAGTWRSPAPLAVRRCLPPPGTYCPYAPRTAPSHPPAPGAAP